MITEMDQSEKVRENRLRRMAERQGVRLMRSRRRDPRATDFGGYMLVDASNNTVLAGATPTAFNLGLDDVERWLTEEPEKKAS